MPAFEHEHYRVRRDTVRIPSGRVVDDYFVSTLSDYALVAAITEAQEVVLVRQWKQGVRRLVLDLPGGMIDGGETAAGAGARELREETGFVAASLDWLGSFDVDASKAANQGHGFLAQERRAQVRARAARDGGSGCFARPPQGHFRPHRVTAQSAARCRLRPAAGAPAPRLSSLGRPSADK